MNCEDLRLVFDLLVFLVIILPQSQKSVVFAMNLDKYLFRFIVKMTIFWRRRESENYLVIVLCLDKAIFHTFSPLVNCHLYTLLDTDVSPCSTPVLLSFTFYLYCDVAISFLFREVSR